jgi:hypothetical protein
MRVKNVIENHDDINHVGLKFDIESGSIIGGHLIFEGKTTSNPDSWCISIDKTEIKYHYDNHIEYEEDIQILIQ